MASLAAAVGALLATSQVSAAPILIDFTDTAWSGAAGQSTYSQSYGSLEVTLTGSGGLLSFDADAPASAGSLSLSSDGIGIGDDEIGGAGAESIAVSFNSAVTVLGYYLLDLFAGEGPTGEAEGALVSFWDGTSFLDSGSAQDGVGFYARDGLSLVDTLGASFSASGGRYSDFALGGILVDDGSPLLLTRLAATDSLGVPEPATLGILGLGLLGLGFARRRMR